jgi:hemolysin type calcium-binding protein/WD40 repeat protein
VKKQLAFLVAGLVLVLVASGELARAAAGPEANDPQDSLPAWSSDGVHLSFERTAAPSLQHVLSMTSAGEDLYLASMTGALRSYVPHGSNLLIESGDETLLTPGGRFAGPPQVIRGTDATASPDGTNVAYLRGGTLYAAALDGSGERALATGVAPPPDDVVGPAWSPDGKQIAIASFNALLLVQTDGSGSRTLATAGDANDNPSWSHDGSMLAWERHENGHWTLWFDTLRTGNVLDLEGTPSSNSRFPQFSPVSNTVAFISDRQHVKGGATPYQYALYLTDDAVDLGTTQKVLDDVHPYSPPRWSPTAALIAVSAGEECRRWGIYVGRGFERQTYHRHSNICRFDGTAKADAIVGSPYFDIINGNGGNDVIRGGSGNDKISGENGNDTILAGAGNDFVLAGPGDDKVFGGPGNDTIVPGNGRDTIDCGAGNDTVDGAGPLDRIAKNCEHVRR